MLASFRCNLALNDSGTEVAWSLAVLIPGSNSNSLSHRASISVDVLSEAMDTVFRKVVRNLMRCASASHTVDLSLELATLKASSRHSSMISSSISSRRLLLYVCVTKSSS